MLLTLEFGTRWGGVIKNSVDKKLSLLRGVNSDETVWRVTNPARVIFLTFVLAISAGAIFYALTYTATFSSSLRPFIATFGVIFLVILLLHGVIDVNDLDSFMIQERFHPENFQLLLLLITKYCKILVPANLLALPF